MTDDRRMDETQPERTRADEPTGFGDLPMQPTGSGVADEQTAFEQSELDSPSEGTAGYGNTGVTPPPTEGGQPPVGEADGRETRNTEF